MNRAILIGNVGKDPEVKYLDSGVAIANFSLATSDKYKKKDGETVTSTEWHRIVVWRGLAEVVEKYVRKGSQLMIEGKIKTREYETKDGQKRYTTEIYADNMQLLDRKDGGEGNSTERALQQAGKMDAGTVSTPQTYPTNTVSKEEVPEANDLPF
jgi:single-strand DNA-binding protein